MLSVNIHAERMLWSLNIEMKREVRVLNTSYYVFRFGGGPACNHLFECATCEQAAEALNKRITLEMETFRQLNHDFQVTLKPSYTVGHIISELK